VLSFLTEYVGRSCKCPVCRTIFRLAQPAEKPKPAPEKKPPEKKPQAAAAEPESEPVEAPCRLDPPAVLRALGLAAMVASIWLPFYGTSEWAPRSGFFQTWRAGGSLGPWLTVVLLAIVPLTALTLARPRRAFLRMAAFLFGLAGFAGAWVALALRGFHAGASPQGPGRVLEGLGLGLALYLAGSVVVLASAFVRRPRMTWSQIYVAPLQCLLLAGVLVAGFYEVTHLLAAWRPSPLAVRAAPVPCPDVFGLEDPEGLAVRIAVANRGHSPVAVTRSGPELPGTGRKGCSIRLAVQHDAGGPWVVVQNPAWSGPWPVLDFRSRREVGPGESWVLDSALFRGDGPAACARRPGRLAVELHDGMGWLRRRRELDLRAPQPPSPNGPSPAAAGPAAVPRQSSSTERDG